MSLTPVEAPLGIDIENEYAIVNAASSATPNVGDIVQLSFASANLSNNRVAKCIAVATSGFTQNAEAVGLAWYGVVVTSPTVAAGTMRVLLRGIVRANCAAAQTPVDGTAMVLLRPTNAAVTLTVCAAGDQGAVATKAVATPLETTSGAGLAWVYFNGIEGVQLVQGA